MSLDKGGKMLPHEVAAFDLLLSAVVGVLGGLVGIALLVVCAALPYALFYCMSRPSNLRWGEAKRRNSGG